MTINWQKDLQTLVDQGLIIKDIVRCAGCSFPTVQHWLEGSSAPHPALQHALLNDLTELLIAKKDKPYEGILSRWLRFWR